MNVLIERDFEALSLRAARLFVDISRDCILGSGRFVAALSGGNTPQATYALLATAEYQKRMDWNRIHLFFVDERFVPPDHPNSNFGLIYNNLLRTVPIPADHIHPIHTAGLSPPSAAKDYEDRIRRFFGIQDEDAFPVFDLIVLGIGRDGHTASLFPGADSLSETRHLVIPVVRTNTEHDRISLTLPVLNHAANILFLVSGREKAEIVENVVKKKVPALPASMINPKHGKCLLLIDEEAGENISDLEVKRNA